MGWFIQTVVKVTRFENRVTFITNRLTVKFYEKMFKV